MTAVNTAASPYWAKTCMYVCVCACVYGWTDVFVHGWMECVTVWLDVCVHRCMYGCVHGWSLSPDRGLCIEVFKALCHADGQQHQREFFLLTQRQTSTSCSHSNTTVECSHFCTIRFSASRPGWLCMQPCSFLCRTWAAFLAGSTRCSTFISQTHN